MKKIAVIFDMDGVLVDNKKYHLDAWQLFLRKHGIEVSYDEIVSTFGNTNREILKHFFGNTLTEEQIELWSYEKEYLYRVLFQKEIVPAPGLVNLLNILKHNNIPLAIATSAPPANANFVVDNTQIREFFSYIVDETMVKRGKPDPELYLKAADRLGMNPADCIVFEDSLAGIASAQNAGMKVIAITTTFPYEKIFHANRVINHFDEVTLDMIMEIAQN